MIKGSAKYYLHESFSMIVEAVNKLKPFITNLYDGGLSEKEIFPVWVKIMVEKDIPKIMVGIASETTFDTPLTNYFEVKFNKNAYIKNIVNTIKKNPIDHDRIFTIDTIDDSVVKPLKKWLKLKKLAYNKKIAFTSVFRIDTLDELNTFYKLLG